MWSAAFAARRGAAVHVPTVEYIAARIPGLLTVMTRGRGPCRLAGVVLLMHMPM